MSQRKRILLIEDEEEIAALIKLQAENMGYQLHVEVDGINGFRTIEREKPDLVILDIMLPGQNGFDIVRKIKNHAHLKKINVIILSEKNEELDIILGLELGADDYITKPFSVKILLSKVKAILRRKIENTKSSKNINFSDFTLETDRYILRKGAKEIRLTLSEFGILKRLLTNRGQVLSRSQLIDDVNNDDAFIVDRNIDVHVAALRKKLGSYNLIETVRGIGYRYKESTKF
ncbi:MAG: Transcriptional regulatory protein YycF [Candidatus Anoxychlamydiales bacterium]|nr:Transcriptional regulatory protein YycF [Candidatus Anoxychlamydiales bacterium]NGX35200.1 Transcriptional regulatory protein YycF [Candidatus Anoxychlamydiales bacterium]